MLNRAVVRVDRKDHLRAILTDVLPFETPLMFSNDGLYRFLTRNQSTSVGQELVAALKGERQEHAYTKPFKYSIRKNASETRRLVLFHPAAQVRFAEVYDRYESLVVYATSKSRFSLRSPSGVVSTFYRPSSLEWASSYKTTNTSLSDTDGLTRHAPSYFTYRGFDRLYKFLSSREFSECEEKFHVLMSCDVSKCFDSVYTHSIAWVMKGKDYSKANTKPGQFANDFDRAMQFSNFNETSGIPIGPEVSRVFAEILLQKVDVNVISACRKKSLTYGDDYYIRRYVDDYYVFAPSREIADSVKATIAQELRFVNLHLNDSKTELAARPFTTKRTSAIRECKKVLEALFAMAIEEVEADSPSTKFAHSVDRQVEAFLSDTRSILSIFDLTYDDVASVLVAMCDERIKRVARKRRKHCEGGEERVERAQRIMLLFLRISIWLFGVSPQVTSSYRVASSIIILLRYVKRTVATHRGATHEEILLLGESLCQSLLRSSSSFSAKWRDYIPIELLNVLVALCESDNAMYRLKPSTIAHVFNALDCDNCFVACAALFCSAKDNSLIPLRDHILGRALVNVERMQLGALPADQAIVALTCIFSPFLNIKVKRKLLKGLLGRRETAPNREFDEFLADIKDSEMFVSWKRVDLLHLLQKKRLNQMY